MLKKCLLGILSILGLGLSFSSAGSYQVVSESYSTGCNDCSVSASTYDADLVCIVNDTCSTWSFGYNFDHGDWGGQMGQIPLEHLSDGLGVCGKDTIYYTINTNCNYIVNYLTIDIFDLNIIQDGSTYTYNINSGVNLNLSSDIDFDTSDYPNISFTSNLSGGSCTGGRSELKINDIVFEGKPFVNINIPDYIQWDYTGNENQYDIYVGSGYDQDYIDSILKINSYRPDSEDFTQTFVSGLTLIFPYIFVALLIAFIWKLLKRVFK